MYSEQRSAIALEAWSRKTTCTVFGYKLNV